MLSRLAEAQQRQRALVSDTAHELRSPIASIRTQLEVALDFPDGQDWAATAADVHADVLRLARLAEDLLLLARLDEQAVRRTDPGRAGEPVDLAGLCRSVVCRYADARVRSRPVTVVAPAPTAADGGGASLVAGDRATARPAAGEPGRQRGAVRQVRGRAFRPPGRPVGRARGHRRRARLAAADRDRAFDRFARLDDARSRDGEEAGGAGLGLAIVRATAQAYGGTATLESAPDPAPGAARGGAPP